jgi:hypothetical protein
MTQQDLAGMKIHGLWGRSPALDKIAPGVRLKTSIGYRGSLVAIISADGYVRTHGETA